MARRRAAGHVLQEIRKLIDTVEGDAREEIHIFSEVLFIHNLFYEELKDNIRIARDIRKAVKKISFAELNVYVIQLLQCYNDHWIEYTKFLPVCNQFETVGHQFTDDALIEYVWTIKVRHLASEAIFKKFMDGYHQLKQYESMVIVKIRDMLEFEFDYLLARYRMFKNEDKLASVFFKIHQDMNKYVDNAGINNPRPEVYPDNDYNRHRGKIIEVKHNICIFVLFEMGKISLKGVKVLWTPREKVHTLNKILDPLTIQTRFYNVPPMAVHRDLPVVSPVRSPREEGVVGPVRSPREEGVVGPVRSPREEGVVGPVRSPREEGVVGPVRSPREEGVVGPEIDAAPREMVTPDGAAVPARDPTPPRVRRLMTPERYARGMREIAERNREREILTRGLLDPVTGEPLAPPGMSAYEVYDWLSKQMDKRKKRWHLMEQGLLDPDTWEPWPVEPPPPAAPPAARPAPPPQRRRRRRSSRSRSPRDKQKVVLSPKRRTAGKIRTPPKVSRKGHRSPIAKTKTMESIKRNLSHITKRVVSQRKKIGPAEMRRLATPRLATPSVGDRTEKSLKSFLEKTKSVPRSPGRWQSPSPPKGKRKRLKQRDINRAAARNRAAIEKMLKRQGVQVEEAEYYAKKMATVKKRIPRPVRRVRPRSKSPYFRGRTPRDRRRRFSETDVLDDLLFLDELARRPLQYEPPTPAPARDPWKSPTPPPRTPPPPPPPPPTPPPPPPTPPPPKEFLALDIPRWKRGPPPVGTQKRRLLAEDSGGELTSELESSVGSTDETSPGINVKLMKMYTVKGKHPTTSPIRKTRYDMRRKRIWQTQEERDRILNPMEDPKLYCPLKARRYGTSYFH